jgi:carotenoid 1,2-hydratase
MLSLSDPRAPMPQDLLDRPGAFLWWYVDVRGPGGDGLVLIWSYALPFLPPRPGAPRTRPSLNLATYRGGRPELYLFQEQPPESVSWDPAGRWTWETSRMAWSHTEDRLALDVELDLEVPGSSERLTGRVHLEGPRSRVDAQPAEGHLWAPLMGVAQATVDLRHGAWTQQITGTGYHDRNACPRPYAELGIRDWIWGRAALGDRMLIWYLVRGAGREDRLLMVERDGQVRELSLDAVDPGARSRDVYGLHWHPRIRLVSDGQEIEIVQDPPAERGPFYLRHPVSVRGGLGDGAG